MLVSFSISILDIQVKEREAPPALEARGKLDLPQAVNSCASYCRVLRQVLQTTTPLQHIILL